MTQKFCSPLAIQGGHVLDLWISFGCVMGDALRMDFERQLYPLI